MDVIAFVSKYNASANLRQVINSNHKNMTDVSTAVNALENNLVTVSVYPNPASDNIYVSVSENHAAGSRLIITDFSGKEILSRTLDKKISVVETKNISNGIYFYHILSGKEITARGKFIVSH
jgi:hypothetical protein